MLSLYNPKHDFQVEQIDRGEGKEGGSQLFYWKYWHQHDKFEKIVVYGRLEIPKNGKKSTIRPNRMKQNTFS